MATSNNLQEWLWVSQTGNRITSGLRFWPELNQYVEPRALVGSMVFYLAMVAVLRWYMGDERKALQLNTVMRIYNVCQVGCTVCLLARSCCGRQRLLGICRSCCAVG